MTQTHPTFTDMTDIMALLPVHAAFKTTATEPMTYLADWLSHYSRTLDLSRGFLVNRCALYWTGYDAPDGFDGQRFVDSCQDSKGNLRQLSQILDTDLQIFELDPHTYSSRTADELAMAASYGMMAIEEGTQLFCAASFGRGVDSAAEKALSALTDGINPESFMTAHCGLDHAAMLGAACACVLKGIPMIVEGETGRLVKSMLEKFSGKQYGSIILADDLNLPINHALPGQRMVMTAIMLKTLYTAQEKTDCGKVKQAA